MNNFEFSEEFKNRTREFALRVIRLFKALPEKPECQVIGKQLLRSGTSVAANYRAACRSRSRAEFISKMNVVIEEADESVFWIELLFDTGIISIEKLSPLLKEANEILCIVSKAQKTAKSHK